MLKNSIDVALVTETNLKDKKNIRLDSRFKVYRLDRDGPREGGGVMIVVKRSLPHRLLPLPNTNVIKAFFIEVTSTAGKFSVGVAYFPGVGPMATALAFKHDMINLISLYSPMILGGDFNARHSMWNCQRANQAGNILYDLLSRFDFLINFTPTPTHFPADSNRNPSTIDLVLSKGAITCTDLTTDDTLHKSDHLPVIFSIDDEVETNSETSYFKDFKNADWRKFTDFLNTHVSLPSTGIDFFDSVECIDDSICLLTQALVDAEDEAVPMVERQFKDVSVPDAVKILLARRRAVKRRRRRTRDDSLKQQEHELSKLIQEGLAHAVNTSFSRSVAALNENDSAHKKLYQLTKNLKRKHGKMPMLKVEGRRIFTDKEKANAIAKVLDDAHHLTHDMRGPRTFERKVRTETDNLRNSTPPIDAADLIRPKQIVQLIKRLKNRKAPGADRISNQMLKRLPRKCIVLLTYIFNACIKLSYFPDSWKVATVLAFRKPNKDPSDPKSYHPISLLSSIGKLFERLIFARLEVFCNENHIVNDEQFGFRAGHSCAHQVIRVAKYVKKGLSRKKSVAAVTLDIERAFDTVWHDGLIFKLISLNCPTHLSKIIQSFLQNRTFRVKVGSDLSESFDIVAGVPQGIVLSPILYSIYTSDIPIPKNCLLGQYADDTLIATEGLQGKAVKRRLEVGLKKIKKFFDRWKIKINAQKFEAIWFSNRRKRRYLPPDDLAISDVRIPWKPTIKYLGIRLDKKLTYAAHIAETAQKTQNIIRQLYGLINRRSKLATKNKLLLYKTIFRPLVPLSGADVPTPTEKSCKLCKIKF